MPWKYILHLLSKIKYPIQSSNLRDLKMQMKIFSILTEDTSRLQDYAESCPYIIVLVSSASENIDPKDLCTPQNKHRLSESCR